jgi:hypothetical protein
VAAGRAGGGPWINGYGKLHRITGRYAAIVHLCLCLATAVVVIRQFIQHARPGTRQSR